MLLPVIVIFMILVIFFVVNIVKHQRAKVAIQNQKVTDEINFIDKERGRIAADLHDGVGAFISAVKLQLECIGGLDEAGKDIIKKSGRLIDKVVKNLKCISYNMVPKRTIESIRSRILERCGCSRPPGWLFMLLTMVCIR